MDTQQIMRHTQFNFESLNFLFVCQNISACLKLNRLWLVIVFYFIRNIEPIPTLSLYPMVMKNMQFCLKGLKTFQILQVPMQLSVLSIPKE